MSKSKFIKYIGVEASQIRDYQITLVYLFYDIPQDILLTLNVVSSFDVKAALIKHRVQKALIDIIEL